MLNDFYSNYVDDCLLIEQEKNEIDKAIEEKIQKAQSIDELADILSDELTKSLMNQIKF
jgi:hypothetical protein